jgi:hypothetical protein
MRQNSHAVPRPSLTVYLRMSMPARQHDRWVLGRNMTWAASKQAPGFDLMAERASLTCGRSVANGDRGRPQQLGATATAEIDDDIMIRSNWVEMATRWP